MAMLPELSIDKYGNQCWYLNDKFHREDGPAAIYVSGIRLWYRDGKRHRGDGPAIIYADGSKYWYVNGILYYTNKEYQTAAGLTDQDMTAIILTYGNIDPYTINK